MPPAEPLLPLLLFPSSAPMRSAVPISPRPELEVVCVLLWPVSSSVKRDSSDDSPPEEVLFVFVSVLISESITGARSASILALLPFVTPACFANASVTPCLLSPNIFPIILSPSSRSALSSCSAAERPLLCCPSASYSDSAPTFVPALSDMACTSSGMALPIRFSACFSFTPAAFATCFTELPDISSPASIPMILPMILSPSVAVR